jgi:tRNA threonylcarbamoyladenosine modification (KEOPS) complex Cgi121 subunit
MAGEEVRVSVSAVLCVPPPGHEEVKERLRSELRGSLVQTLSASAVQNVAYLEMVAAQTLHALKVGGLLARKPEVDFLMRVASTSQISDAIRSAGARGGEPYVLVVAGEQAPKGWIPPEGAKRLPRRRLSKREVMRIEEAALLSSSWPKSRASAS